MVDVRLWCGAGRAPFIEQIERLARGQRVEIGGTQRLGELLFWRRLRCGPQCREQRQVAQPGSNPAGCLAGGFELFEHGFCAVHDIARHPGEAGHGKTIGTIGRAIGQFVQQHQIALPFPRPHVVQRQRLAGFGQPGEFVVMGREQAAAGDARMHRFGHGPCQREAIIG